MRNKGDLINQNTKKDLKGKIRFLSPPPNICTKKLSDSQDTEYCKKFQNIPFSLNSSPTKLEVKQKAASFIDKKVIRSRPSNKPRSLIVNLEENKSEKLKKLNRSRAHLQYLKKNLIKRNCSVSILDFWSNEMLLSATKLISRPKVVEKNSEFHLPVLKTFKKPKITPTPNAQTIKISKKNYGDCIESITKACDDTFMETQKLKTRLNNSLSQLLI